MKDDLFAAAETGRRLGKRAYDAALAALRPQLLDAQRELRARGGGPLIVIVSGVETAGKSEVVNRLNEWLDARGVRTLAFWDESDEERERPRHWRFWRALPPRGSIAVFFGSWYTRPIVARALGETTRAAFDAELQQVVELERLLVDDGAAIVKLWFHLSRRAQEERLQRLAHERDRKLTPWERRFSAHYDRFAAVSAAAIRATDRGHAPWQLVDAEDPRSRDLAAGRLVLAALAQAGLAHGAPGPAAAALRDLPMTAAAAATAAAMAAAAAAATTSADAAPRSTATAPTAATALTPAATAAAPNSSVAVAAGSSPTLAAVDLTRQLGPRAYERRLAAAQARLNALAWKARRQGSSTVVVFEGWDAAGKGSAIRRVTAALDARLCRVIPVAAPTDEERARHYLWRFWRQLPRAGYLTIFDRSWYGRVLVERVEGLASAAEWSRAYDEIGHFERQLAAHGIVVQKLWLQISPDEQLRRFEARSAVPHKQHKIGAEDWRNRARWADYELALEEMFQRCSHPGAPWTIVPAEDKHWARVAVVQTLADRLEAALAG